MESLCTIGAIASKNASAFSSVSSRIASASGAEVKGPVATMTLRQSAGGRPAISRGDLDQGMLVQRVGDGGGKSVAIHRQRATGRHLVGVGARMISEPSRRISACSSPTALLAASSERNELEQTSSARPAVWCASVIRCGPHLVQHHAGAGLGDLPCGFRTGEAGADDMDGWEMVSVMGAGVARFLVDMQWRAARYDNARNEAGVIRIIA